MVEKIYGVTFDMYAAKKEPEIKEYEVFSEKGGYYILFNEENSDIRMVLKESVKYAVTDYKTTYMNCGLSDYFYKKSYADDYLKAIKKYKKLWALEDRLAYLKNVCITTCKKSIEKYQAQIDFTQEELDRKLAAKLDVD